MFMYVLQEETHEEMVIHISNVIKFNEAELGRGFSSNTPCTSYLQLQHLKEVTKGLLVS